MSRDEPGLMIAAQNGWIIALDNLSGLSSWLSDALCRIATGGGFGTRELWTNTDEVLIHVQRPIVLNGIDDIATRQDLIDRAIIINLDPIPDDKRKPEAEFWQSFNTKKPAILGALLDLVSRALRQLPNTHLNRLPRMADFAKWATAAEPIEEKGTFMRAYQDNRQSAIEASLEGSPVATVLREMVKEVLHWQGTATELLNLLWQRADERTKMQRSWPKSAKGLSGQLRRLATALRATGIEIKHKRAGKGGTRIIHIKTVCKDSSEPSAASASEQEQTLTADEWLTHMKNRRWDVEHANMSAVKHIQDTHRQGGSVKVDVDDLNLIAPQPLPADLLNQIRQHKAELLAYLSADAANTIDPMGHVLTVDQANGGNYLEKLGTVAPASLMCHLEPRR